MDTATQIFGFILVVVGIGGIIGGIIGIMRWSRS